APLARELAAVLSCGPGAVLSHQSAAALRGFREPEPDGPVHVTVAGRNPGVREGVVVHRMRAPHPADRAEREGIPVTSPARTLFDLASTLSARELERAFDEARVLCLLSPGALRAALDGHPGCRGTAALRALAAEDNGTTITRSELEERFLALVRRARLPA